MAAYQKVFAYVMALIVCLAVVEAAVMTKRRASYYDALNELAEKEDEPMTRADDLILRLLDAIVAHEESRGANKDEMHDLMRKRAGIRKCFFHAVNCW